MWNAHFHLLTRSCFCLKTIHGAICDDLAFLNSHYTPSRKSITPPPRAFYKMNFFMDIRNKTTMYSKVWRLWLPLAPGSQACVRHFSYPCSVYKYFFLVQVDLLEIAAKVSSHFLNFYDETCLCDSVSSMDIKQNNHCNL